MTRRIRIFGIVLVGVRPEPHNDVYYCRPAALPKFHETRLTRRPPFARSWRRSVSAASGCGAL